MSHAGHIHRTCPYLGLMEDADTSLAFPSAWNGCHRCRPLASPNLKHQSEFCLGEGHRQCPVFLNPQDTLPLPNHLRAPHSRAKRPTRSRTWILALLLIGIAALAGLAWGFLTPGMLLSEPSSTPTWTPQPTATETPSLTATASKPPTVTRTPSSTPTLGTVTMTFTVTRTPTATRTATLTPSPTATRTHTPSLTLTAPPSLTPVLSAHRLETPIGADPQFVIHRVQYGENLNQYAVQYNTSVDAIVLVNYDLKTPVWVDTLIVIPVDITEVDGLPAFEVYLVSGIERSVEALAEELGVKAADLARYNALAAGELLQSGDWLLVPRPRIAQP